MNVIGISDIISIRYTRNLAKSLLKTFSKLICCGLKRSAVNAEINICFLLPPVASLVHMLHNVKCKRLALRVGMRLACHIFSTFIKTCITERNCRISVIKKLINLLSLFKPCKSTVLPKNRSSVAQSTLKPIVAAHKRTIAKVKPFIKDFPKLCHISA